MCLLGRSAPFPIPVSPSCHVSLLLSPGHCVLWFHHCPVSWSWCHQVLLSPCTIVTLSPCIVVTPCCQVVIVPCPCHIIVVLVASLLSSLCGCTTSVAHLTCVCSSLSWVSAKWVGTNARWGVLTVVVKITATMNNNQCHCSSFGCHIADCDVAPGFHINELTSEEG